jgi:hypothetical protein
LQVIGQRGHRLVEPKDGERESSETDYGYAQFASKALRELRPDDIKRWYDKLPFGRTAEKLLMVVRAILAHARSRAWIDSNPAEAVEPSAGSLQRRLRLLHPRGDRCARQPGHKRPGRGDLSDRRDDGPSPR